ncbi:hypothetical protein ACWD6K_08590 [Streptomyces sp. NPDC002431]
MFLFHSVLGEPSRQPARVSGRTVARDGESLGQQRGVRTVGGIVGSRTADVSAIAHHPVKTEAVADFFLGDAQAVLVGPPGEVRGHVMDLVLGAMALGHGDELFREQPFTVVQ